jgi:hypothetical protein
MSEMKPPDMGHPTGVVGFSAWGGLRVFDPTHDGEGVVNGAPGLGAGAVKQIPFGNDKERVGVVGGAGDGGRARVVKVRGWGGW